MAENGVRCCPIASTTYSYVVRATIFLSVYVESILPSDRSAPHPVSGGSLRKTSCERTSLLGLGAHFRNTAESVTATETNCGAAGGTMSGLVSVMIGENADGMYLRFTAVTL